MSLKNKKLKLPNVTLAAMTSVKIYETIKALEYSMQDIEFGEVVLITHRKPFSLPEGITYELGDYIDTDYVMLVHYDGFVINPQSWRDEFFEYDYIGSPWPVPAPGTQHCYHDIYGNLCRVGNSVSLRSKKLLEFPRKANLKWEKDEDGFYNEDIFLCCMNKHRIEEAGMKFAPVEVAKYFAHEHPVEEVLDVEAPFAFHKWWGKNESYPRFENPWTRRWLRFKDIVRPLLFWRRFRK